MKRKVFLALALLALMAVGAFAQTEVDFEVQKSADGKSITITGYKGSATGVNIPAKIQNLPVTIIDKEAFFRNTKITGVVISNGVISIGNSAFRDCAYITSVIIPDSVTSIENSAFQSCSRLNGVTIGSGVTKIGNNAFRGCASLTSLTFAGSIPSSGFSASAFDLLGDIRDKYLAAGGGAGTYTRPDDKSTTWTKSASAAAGTPNLKYILTSDGKGYRVSEGVGISDVVIPATYNNLPVTVIDGEAFRMAHISSVTIPNSVTKIGDYAFADCINLKSVTIGSGVQEIGIMAFNNCVITSVTFQGTFAKPVMFNVNSGFEGDLRDKYLAGGAGTYTLSGKTWTKK